MNECPAAHADQREPDMTEVLAVEKSVRNAVAQVNKGHLYQLLGSSTNVDQIRRPNQITTQIT